MISIIIPAYNQHEMTHDCLLSIIKHTGDNYEVIVIDNGSQPQLLHVFNGKYPYPIDVIRNESNLGFPVAVNQGIRAANGDIIILLNNDVIVTPGWSATLRNRLDQYAIVAPVTNYCAGMQKVTIPAYYDEIDLNEKAIKWCVENSGKSTPVNFVIGFCMAFKKSLYEELGEFDESLWPCSGEEIDFCMRARKAGHSIGIANDTYVHHFGSQTFADMQRSGQLNYNEVVTRNDKHLSERWGDVWNRQAV